MVGAARPGGAWGEAGHWSERSEALLAPLLHAAALQGSDMRLVLRWVLRHEADQAAATLTGCGAEIAADVLAGIVATDGREQSGIWSTTAGVLAAYRSDTALDAAEAPNFDPRSLHASNDTVYICAPARYQSIAAPIIVAFLEQVRAGAYESAARWAFSPAAGAGAAEPRLEPAGAMTPAPLPARRPPPVVLVLDEVANIAPLPDLPAMVSEGGGQGVLTIACLQDLSQARQRWGRAADGFLSLFGTKVILPGIADLATLELVSRLGGEEDVPLRSVSRSPWWSGRASQSETWSHHRQRRLPLDAINQLPSGRALVLSGAQAPLTVVLSPWWCTAPFAPVPDARPGVDHETPLPDAMSATPTAPRAAQPEGRSRPRPLSLPD